MDIFLKLKGKIRDRNYCEIYNSVMIDFVGTILL